MSVDWEAISAIADIVGSAATFAAVVVALWTATLPYRPRVELGFSPHTLMFPVPSGKMRRAISITVTNTGYRPVIIHSWGIKLQNAHKIFVILNDYNNPFIKPLPCKIDVDESLNLFYDQDTFYKAMTSALEQGEVSRDRRLEFVVQYGPGKKKTVKSDLKLGDLLNTMKDDLDKPRRSCRKCWCKRKSAQA